LWQTGGGVGIVREMRSPCGAGPCVEAAAAGKAGETRWGWGGGQPPESAVARTPSPRHSGRPLTVEVSQCR